MYYEEKMIDGVLCWRGDPEGEFTPYTVEQLSRKYEQEKEQTSCLRELEEDLRTQLSYEINKSDNLIQEARIWKQEAQTQTATITEIYNLVGQGDTKDYLGAAPVREYVERTEREVSELRAQLARCVNDIKRNNKSLYIMCRRSPGGDPGFLAVAMDLEESVLKLPAQAKADAEVLRCAEKLYQEYFYGNDDEKAMRHNRVLVRSIHNAVRAAKEARG